MYFKVSLLKCVLRLNGYKLACINNVHTPLLETVKNKESRIITADLALLIHYKFNVVLHYLKT